MSDLTQATEMDRKARLSLLAAAPTDRMLRLWASFLGDAGPPEAMMLRGPEIGTVMVRGRTGAKGAAFNLGEMTVTRCSVRLSSGRVGHGHVQGRHPEAARAIALIDALAEDGAADRIETCILAPLRDERRAEKAARAGKAAATKVEFFTMVRGENA